MQVDKIEVKLNKTGLTLPQKADKYLNSIVPFLKRYLKDDLRSIIIFGSIVKGYTSKESDADILIVVSDKVSKKTIKKLNSILMGYEIKYGYLKPKTGIVQKILYCVDKSTGMFISHFICKEKDLLSGKFAHIFSVNKLIAKILAPNDIVYGSVLKRAHTIYGENLIKKTKFTKLSIIQLLKSAFMNVLTSIGGLVTWFFDYKRATLYEMESLKWSLLASYYYVHNDCPNISKIVKYFLKHKICTKSIKSWLGLRKKYQPHGKFSLFVPFNVIRIHMSVVGKPK